MPVYEFTCQSCGERFEKLFRTMSAESDAKCPKCGSSKTARALSLINAGESKGSAGASAGGDMPFCGRCGGPGPCGME